MKTRGSPCSIIVDIEPGIALARAECFEKYRERPVQQPRISAMIKKACLALSAYPRDSLRQFTGFLGSRLTPARSSRSDLTFPADLQLSPSASLPRGA